MFESVLERNFPPRQIGGGATLAIGVHAVVIVAAVGLAARPVRAIDPDIGNIKILQEPLQVRFDKPSTDSGGPAHPPAHHAQHHKVGRSMPVESDNKKRADERPSTTSSSNASSSGESVHASSDQGSTSEGTGVIGNEGGSGTGGRGAMMAIPFGEGMKRPAPIAQPAPVYTREASAVKAAGVVSVRCVITVEGTLKDCRIVQGVPHMDAAVLEALSRWRYTPVTFQGRPVSVYYAINVRLVAP